MATRARVARAARAARAERRRKRASAHDACAGRDDLDTWWLAIHLGGWSGRLASSASDVTFETVLASSASDVTFGTPPGSTLLKLLKACEYLSHISRPAVC
jgi:hypothetical protein